MAEEEFTLKTRPTERDKNFLRGGYIGYYQTAQRWFSGFEKRQRAIHEATDKWIKENQFAILSRFHLHSHSGLKPQELLQFFIEKEILG